jgi:hypothetical protein
MTDILSIFFSFSPFKKLAGLLSENKLYLLLPHFPNSSLPDCGGRKCR